MRDKTEARLAGASFARWKLDVINAMQSDARLLPSDFRVGVALIRHLNGKTRKLFPSHDRLAELSSMKRRNVATCLQRLKDTGWIRWERGTRNRANEYQFDEHTIAEQIARMKAFDMQPSAHQASVSDVHSSACRAVHSSATQHLNMKDPTEKSEAVA